MARCFECVLERSAQSKSQCVLLEQCLLPVEQSSQLQSWIVLRQDTDKNQIILIVTRKPYTVNRFRTYLVVVLLSLWVTRTVVAK